MNAPRVVPSPGVVDMVVEGRIRHLCPFVDEVDHGTVRVEWVTDGSTIELHSLRAYLAGWSEEKISHEQITQKIRQDLEALPGLTITVVSTTWDTAGFRVECSI